MTYGRKRYSFSLLTFSFREGCKSLIKSPLSFNGCPTVLLPTFRNGLISCYDQLTCPGGGQLTSPGEGYSPIKVTGMLERRKCSKVIFITFYYCQCQIYNFLLLNWYLLGVQMNLGHAHKTRYWYL